MISGRGFFLTEIMKGNHGDVVKLRSASNERIDLRFDEMTELFHAAKVSGINGMEQTLSSLALDAGEAGAYPVLTLLGSLALADIELKLVCDGKAPGASQWLVKSTGLSGEFKSVEGGRVKYLTDGVKLAGNGGLILLLK